MDAASIVDEALRVALQKRGEMTLGSKRVADTQLSLRLRGNKPL
jgi:hypothetical protein